MPYPDGGKSQNRTGLGAINLAGLGGRSKMRKGSGKPFDQYFVKGADDQCWEWQGLKSYQGYGKITLGRGTVGQRAKMAHRLSWEISKGPIPEGLCVLHKCDNPPCVNPDHLFLGTRCDNNKDRSAKGRTGTTMGRPGERNHAAKLTEQDVISIRNDSRPMRDIAKSYDIHYQAVYRIKKRILWKHVQDVNE